MYSVYTSLRLLLVTGLPGVYSIYSDLWTISESSQNVLYTLRTFEGCVQEVSRGAPEMLDSNSRGGSSLGILTIICIWNPGRSFDVLDNRGLRD